MKNSDFINSILNEFNNDKIAFEIFDGENIHTKKYKDLLFDILKKANFFINNKQTQKHIALIGKNSYNWITLFFAIIASGNVVIPINPDLPEENIKELLRKADINLCCIDKETGLELTSINNKYYISEIYSKGLMNLNDVNTYEDNDTVMMMATSGTTGRSKIVEISSLNLLEQSKNSEIIGEELFVDKSMLMYPCYHISGITHLLTYLYGNKTLCLGRGIKYLIPDMLALNPTTVWFVPLLLDSVSKMLRLSNKDVKEIFGENIKAICVGGAKANTNSCLEFIKRGIKVAPQYGITEISGMSFMSAINEETISSTGKLSNKYNAKIEDGELLLSGNCVAKGYYKDKEETNKVFINGWFHTGDIASVDENGYYYITGRKKNTIILSNGENVNPEEIEDQLYKSLDIEECLVYGDEKGILVDIYTKNIDVAKESVEKYNKNKPKYFQIYKINFVENPLEKTGTGKIKRKR